MQERTERLVKGIGICILIFLMAVLTYNAITAPPLPEPTVTDKIQELPIIKTINHHSEAHLIWGASDSYEIIFNENKEINSYKFTDIKGLKICSKSVVLKHTITTIYPNGSIIRMNNGNGIVVDYHYEYCVENLSFLRDTK